MKSIIKVSAFCIATLFTIYGCNNNTANTGSEQFNETNNNSQTIDVFQGTWKSNEKELSFMKHHMARIYRVIKKNGDSYLADTYFIVKNPDATITILYNGNYEKLITRNDIRPMTLTLKKDGDNILTNTKGKEVYTYVVDKKTILYEDWELSKIENPKDIVSVISEDFNLNL